MNELELLRMELTVVTQQRNAAVAKVEALEELVDRLQKSIQAAALRPEKEAESVATWEPPVVLPPKWRLIMRGGDGAKYHYGADMTVIVSVATELDGRGWLHMSMSHRRRLPSWEELVLARNVLLGEDRTVYQVLPPKKEHVNICDRVLHVWCCLDGPVLPDFTRGSGSL